MKKIYTLNTTLKTTKSLSVIIISFMFCLVAFNGKAQYCYPTYGNGTGSGDYISLVNIAGTTLNNSSLGAANPYYTLFPANGNSTATLTIGSSYTINVAGGTYGNSYISAWGDWNQDGVFDASEYIATSPNAGNQTNVALISGFTIPASAVAGATRIRFRENDTYPGPYANEACGPTSLSPFGEGEDYIVYLAASVNCAAAPAPGNSTAGQTLVCANTSFNLGLTGNSTNTGGLTYQWQSSPNGTAWTNLGSVQNNALYTISNITATTYYRCVVTCTGTAQSATATPVSVSFNPSINCYCMPNYNWDCSGDNFINFSLANLSAQTTSCTPGTGFTDMTTVSTASINLSAGVTYTLSANTSYSGNGGAAAVGAWIDYDQNGVFDSNEFTYLGYGQPNYTATLSVPLTAPTGNVRMRLKMDANFANSGTQIDPCNNNNNSSYGQTADYLVHITGAPACSAAPNAGSATSTQTLVCPLASYVLDVTGSSIATGLKYQWQVSPNGTAWSNIGNLQNITQLSVGTQSATQHYRCVVTCTSSAATATSSPIVVNSNPLVNCYCVPTYDVNCSGDNIVNFSMANLTAQTPSCTPTIGFTDLTGNAPSNINLNAGATYTMSAVVANSGSTGAKELGAWFDFDQNGIFDYNEFINLGYGVAGTYSTAVTVPLNTASGAIRMRLKLDGNYVSNAISMDPCYNSNSSTNGQTIDYLVNLTAASACAAVPNAGNAISTSTLVCQSTVYSLNVNNSSIATGLNYQWQSSPNGTTWTNMGPAQSNSQLNGISQTATQYYRCVVTCTSSSASAISTPVTVTSDAVVNCYCTPSYTWDCSGDNFVNFSLANLTAQTNTCNPSGYTDMTASVPAHINMTAGVTYTLTAITANSGTAGNASMGAWIDFDHNSVFDGNEFIFLSSGGAGTYTNTVTLPLTTAAGAVRMRLVLDANNAPTYVYACNNSNGSSYGQILDYLVNISTAPLCTGSPVAGNATATESTVCTSQAFTLDLINNAPVLGVSYQWQLSPNGTIWTNFGNASASSTYYVNSQTNATHYRCVLTCTNSAGTSTSTPVIVNQNLFSTCYCSPDNEYCGNVSFTDVTLAGTTNTGITCVGGGYEDMTGTATTATVTAGSTYTLATGIDNNLTGSFTGAWIDFDQNGVFDTYEFTSVGTSSVSGTYTVNSNVVVPFTALAGITTMRLKVEGSYSSVPTSVDPCSAFTGDGHTIDMPVFVIASPGCSGTPVAGTTVADVTTTCFNSSFGLNLTGNSHISGAMYQWQYSPNGTSWTNLDISQNHVPYTVTDQTSATYYRCVVTCTTSALSQTSTPVSVGQNAPTACYCIPTGLDCSSNDEIDKVVFGAINNLSGCSTGGYADYTATSFTPAATASVVAGTANSMTVTLGNDNNENVSVWIDYDRNGSFDNSEYTFIGSPSGSGNHNVIGTVNISASALTGLTRMRVRNQRNNSFGPDDACVVPTGQALRGSGGSPSGETEDYSVYILPTDCSGNTIPNGLSVSASSSSVCPGASVTLDITGAFPAYTGLTYQWQQSPTGSAYANTGSASVTTSITTFPTQSNYYICSILCHGVPAASTSSVYVTLAAPTITVTANSYTVCPAETVTLTATGAANYTWTTNNAHTATTVFSPTITSVFPVKGIAPGGCLANGSVLITVKPATNISGTITTSSSPVPGTAILYKYEPYFTRFDSISSQPIAGNGGYDFPSINYGVYIVKAVPSASSLQVTYGLSSVNWKTAATITHSCATADMQNINVMPLTVLPSGPGSLSGVIYQGFGFGHRPESPYSPLAPGQPIGGIVVKGGKNPGGSMFTQTTTGANGTYTLSNLPLNSPGNDEYFILVDIPGLDTNHTYYRVLTTTNNTYDHLDFEVDSTKINPIPQTNTGINAIANLAGGVRIYPNPANQKVTVSYSLTESSSVKIELYDLLGKSVKAIVQQGEQSAGDHTYSVSLSDLTAGMYFVKLKINNSETSVKLFVTN